MKIYHGTIETFAKRIVKEGLVAHKRNALRLTFNDRNLRAIEVVEPHVSTNPTLAIEYADFRARYEQADKGEVSCNFSSATLQKTVSRRRKQVVPVIIEFTVPDSWELRDDENHPYSSARISKPIPAKYITKVSRLKI